MNISQLRRSLRQRRKMKKREVLKGTADCPRLCVFRSSKHIYASLVDDDSGVTIATASTLVKGGNNGSAGQGGGNIASAQLVGKHIAEKAVERGIKTLKFDRNGFRYHGRIKALADAARDAGLHF